MPIAVTCGGCGKRFKAPDHGAGKKAPCPACKTVISIPAVAEIEEEDEYRLADPPPAPAALKLPPTTPAISAKISSAAHATNQSRTTGVSTGSPGIANSASSGAKTWVPPTRSSTPTWLRHLHWYLALAMIPLAVSIFVPEKSSGESTAQTDDPAAIGEASPSEASKVPNAPPSQATANETSPEDEAKLRDVLSQMSVDDLFASLPGHKLPGAFLARNSYFHWLFAIIAAAAYMTFLVLLASDKSAQPLHLLGLGLFTATGGILLLLGVQMLAQLGFIRVRGGIIGLIFLVLLLIGMSYGAANDPDSGLILSFIGFTAGVGLCEEVCKALPLLFYYRNDNQQTWRGAFLWGLASGTGFGVAEGVMYSQDFYNGIAGPGIYIVRFVSCVALHAIWSGSVGISINQRQYLLQEEHDDENWWMYCLAVLRIIAIPMVLHGLYDTLLKKDMEFVALLTAAASFGYLAWQISHLRSSDDEDERAAHVASYIRAKTAALQS